MPEWLVKKYLRCMLLAMTAKDPTDRKTKKKKKGGRAPLTRERVLGAALRMADRDGLEVLSMRNLARR